MSAPPIASLVDRGPPGPPRNLYVHVPFCRDRCTYCAFATLPDDPGRHATLVDGILREARHAPDLAPLDTVYVGGGTPSLLGDELAHLLEGLRQRYETRADAEITLEANPAEISRGNLQRWADLGVTRLSIGVQTFDDATLKRLGRHHGGEDARRALTAVGARWPGTWSADLLVGWHGQTLPRLRDDVDTLLDHQPPHVSIYGLTIEPGTPLADRHARGEPVRVDHTVDEAMDDLWSDRLADAGLERYEVSNFARPGHRSRHNQAYWNDADHLGLGPGATSAIHPYRWHNERLLSYYLKRSPRARRGCERIAPDARLLEVLAVGLRTTDGVAAQELDRRFGPAWRPTVARDLAQLVDDGVIDLSAEVLRLDDAQRLSIDRLLMEALSGSVGIPS